MRRALSGLIAALVLSVPLAAQQRSAKTDAVKPAPKTAAKTEQAKQPAGKAASVSESGGIGQMTIMREVFTYESAGRRDPMSSLSNTASIRPLLTEIECIGILYDEDGRNSEAILRSLDKKKTYRVKVGQSLGRMTVAQITRREVVFTIDEYGFARQVSLPVKPDTSAARTP